MVKGKRQPKAARSSKKETQNQLKDVPKYTKMDKSASSLGISSITQYTIQTKKVDSTVSVVFPEVPIPAPDEAALPSGSNDKERDTQQKEIRLTRSTEVGVVSPSCQPSQTQDQENSQRTEMKNISQAKQLGKKQKSIVFNCSTKANPSPKSKKKKPTKEARTKPLTDYFPVRRSERKPHTDLMKDKVKEVEEAILNEVEKGFEVKEFIGKGRGVITNKNIKRGDFVLEYCGELICLEEAKKREKIYEKDDAVGCYMYYFSYKNNRYCVDATKESGRLARLVNHSKHGNLKTKSFLVQGIPRLILVAKRDIEPGEELLYDYGDRSKYSLQSHPWLAL